MASTAEQDLQVAEQGELASGAEQTRQGASFSPVVDIFETDVAITLLADLPGVAPSALEVKLEEGVLTITGSQNPPKGDKEEVVLREYDTGSFFRQFRLAETIDQAGISAKLNDGVLRLELPKVEAAKPRQIKIRT